MMTLKNLKEENSSNRFPHKLIHVRDIEAIEDNVLLINNKEIGLSKIMQNYLDRILSISKRQSDIINNVSGTEGISKFRNYMSVANGMENDAELLLIANPEDKQVHNIIPIKQSYIPVESFFDFAEIFADKFDYKLSRYEVNNALNPEITIFFESEKPQYASILKNDEFITNNFYLHWTPSDFGLGNIFKRLVCENGQMVEVKKNLLPKAHNLSPNNMSKILKAVEGKRLIGAGFEEFEKNAELANISQASLREMERAFVSINSILHDKEATNTIVPYHEEVANYKLKGFNVDKIKRNAVSRYTVWELYNILTHFATHKSADTEANMPFTNVLKMANVLLYGKRDIVNYHNIY